MSLDTDYLNHTDFMIDDKKFKLRVNEEYKENALVLFIHEKDDESAVVKKFKEILTYGIKGDKKIYLGIGKLSKEIKQMVNESSSWVYSHFIIFYLKGEEVDKFYLTPSTKTEKLYEFLEMIGKKI